MTQLPSPSPHAPPPPPPPPSARQQPRSISGLTTALTAVLWAAVAFAALGMIAFANRAAVVGDMLNARSFRDLIDASERADDADSFVGVAAFLMVIVSITILTLLIIWMWRVAKNAELLGRTNPRLGPGWTIGGWFIPFANLVIPVLVVQDLWRGSDPETPAGEATWRTRPGSTLVGWWWAAYVVSLVRFGLNRDDATGTRGSLASVKNQDVLAVVGMGAAIAAAILLIYVVRRITQRQSTALAGELPLA